jgi:hypothetical protein
MVTRGDTGEINVLGVCLEDTEIVLGIEQSILVFVAPYTHRPVVEEVLTGTATTKLSGYTKSALTANSVFTVPDGTFAGQRKVVTKGEPAGWTLTVTVLTHVLGSPTNYVLLAQYETLELEWTGATGWMTLSSGVAPALNPVKQVEVDWGDNPLVETVKTFAIADAGISALNRISAWLAYEAATGRDLDENELDTFVLATVAGAGFFTLSMHSLLGPAHGLYKVNYQIGTI